MTHAFTLHDSMSVARVIGHSSTQASHPCSLACLQKRRLKLDSVWGEILPL